MLTTAAPRVALGPPAERAGRASVVGTENNTDSKYSTKKNDFTADAESLSAALALAFKAEKHRGASLSSWRRRRRMGRRRNAQDLQIGSEEVSSDDERDSDHAHDDDDDDDGDDDEQDDDGDYRMAGTLNVPLGGRNYRQRLFRDAGAGNVLGHGASASSTFKLSHAPSAASTASDQLMISIPSSSSTTTPIDFMLDPNGFAPEGFQRLVEPGLRTCPQFSVVVVSCADVFSGVSALSASTSVDTKNFSQLVLPQQVLACISMSTEGRMGRLVVLVNFSVEELNLLSPTTLRDRFDVIAALVDEAVGAAGRKSVIGSTGASCISASDATSSSSSETSEAIVIPVSLATRSNFIDLCPQIAEWWTGTSVAIRVRKRMRGGLPVGARFFEERCVEIQTVREALLKGAPAAISLMELSARPPLFHATRLVTLRSLMGDKLQVKASGFLAEGCLKLEDRRRIVLYWQRNRRTAYVVRIEQQDGTAIDEALPGRQVVLVIELSEPLFVFGNDVITSVYTASSFRVLAFEMRGIVMTEGASIETGSVADIHAGGVRTQGIVKRVKVSQRRIFSLAEPPRVELGQAFDITISARNAPFAVREWHPERETGAGTERVILRTRDRTPSYIVGRIIHALSPASSWTPSLQHMLPLDIKHIVRTIMYCARAGRAFQGIGTLPDELLFGIISQVTREAFRSRSF